MPSSGDEANSSVVNVDAVEEVWNPRATAGSHTSQPGADLHKARTGKVCATDQSMGDEWEGRKLEH